MVRTNWLRVLSVVLFTGGLIGVGLAWGQPVLMPSARQPKSPYHPESIVVTGPNVPSASASRPAAPAGAVAANGTMTFQPGERIITVCEPGKPEQKCRVLRTYTTPEGNTAHEVKALDSGEVMTIVESGPGLSPALPGVVPGLPVEADKGLGSRLRAATSRIFRRGSSEPTEVIVSEEQLAAAPGEPVVTLPAPRNRGQGWGPLFGRKRGSETVVSSTVVLPPGQAAPLPLDKNAAGPTLPSAAGSSTILQTGSVTASPGKGPVLPPLSPSATPAGASSGPSLPPLSSPTNSTVLLPASSGSAWPPATSKPTSSSTVQRTPGSNSSSYVLPSGTKLSGHAPIGPATARYLEQRDSKWWHFGRKRTAEVTTVVSGSKLSEPQLTKRDESKVVASETAQPTDWRKSWGKPEVTTTQLAGDKPSQPSTEKTPTSGTTSRSIVPASTLPRKPEPVLPVSRTEAPPEAKPNPATTAELASGSSPLPKSTSPAKPGFTPKTSTPTLTKVEPTAPKLSSWGTKSAAASAPVASPTPASATVVSQQPKSEPAGPARLEPRSEPTPKTLPRLEPKSESTAAAKTSEQAEPASQPAVTADSKTPSTSSASAVSKTASSSRPTPTGLSKTAASSRTLTKSSASSPSSSSASKPAFGMPFSGVKAVQMPDAAVSPPAPVRDPLQDPAQYARRPLEELGLPQTAPEAASKGLGFPPLGFEAIGPKEPAEPPRPTSLAGSVPPPESKPLAQTPREEPPTDRRLFGKKLPLAPGTRSVLAAHEAQVYYLPVPMVTVPPGQPSTPNAAPPQPPQVTAVSDSRLVNAFSPPLSQIQALQQASQQVPPHMANAFFNGPMPMSPPYAQAMPAYGYGPGSSYAMRPPMYAPPSGYGQMAMYPQPMAMQPNMVSAMGYGGQLVGYGPQAGYGAAPHGIMQVAYHQPAQAPMAMPAGYPPPAADAGLQQSLRVLRDALYPSQREWAADALSRVDWRTNPQVVPALVAAAREDPAATVRAACVRSLARMNANGVMVLEALQALKTDTDPRVRQEVEAALGHLNRLPKPAAARY
jgi:hypothetical protein